MLELKTLMTGISFGEQPRWHENRLWFSDWGAREVIAVDPDVRGAEAASAVIALPGRPPS